jgi:serine/threonine protein kinase
VILFKKFDKGETLDKKIGKLYKSKAVDIILKVSDIVKSLLDNGVYHWDIKLSNIWITDKGEIILFDFGNSFMPEEHEFLERGLYRLGTNEYMSGNRLQYIYANPKVDFFRPSDEIFSLGMSLAKLEGFELTPADDEEIEAADRELDYGKIRSVIIRRLDKYENVIPEELLFAIEDAIFGQYSTIDEFIEAVKTARPKILIHQIIKLVRASLIYL